jgi:Rad3-related DNA helicase
MNSNYSFVESFAEEQKQQNKKITEFEIPFNLAQEHRKVNRNNSRTALGNILDESKLSQIFYGRENIRRIQKKIKREILVRTNGKFKLEADQDEDDLLIAMRAVYFDEAKHLPDNIIRQVKGLNEKTINYIMPDIITNIKQEYDYLRDINKPLKPIMRPTNMNNGNAQLPSITSIWEI